MNDGLIFFGVKDAGLIGLRALIKKSISVKTIITMDGKEQDKFKSIANEIGADLKFNPSLKSTSFQETIKDYKAISAVSISFPKIFNNSLCLSNLDN